MSKRPRKLKENVGERQTQRRLNEFAREILDLESHNDIGEVIYNDERDAGWSSEEGHNSSSVRSLNQSTVTSETSTGNMTASFEARSPESEECIEEEEEFRFLNNTQDSDADSYAYDETALLRDLRDDEEIRDVLQFDYSSSEEEYLDDEHRENMELQKNIGTWMVECGISLDHGTKLLRELRKKKSLQFLPTDSRTIRRTMRSVITKEISPGIYYHFGLRSGILRAIQTTKTGELPQNIQYHINVDGLPLSKNSNSQFWCIIASVFDSVFAVGIYKGEKKPKNSNAFLNDTVQEAIELEREGIEVNGKTYFGSLCALVCDAPARSYVTKVKGHGGYYGCSKCETKGRYYRVDRTKKGRVVFPEVDAILRTDASFRGRNQPQHHIGESILELLSIDMVQNVPIDPMHLLDIGMMRKLLNSWKNSRHPGVKLDQNLCDKLNSNILSLNGLIPEEFQRRESRSLDEVDRWKATQLKFFRKHAGPLLLKDCLTDVYYEHFLNFHVATKLLSHPRLCRNEDIVCYCEQILSNFVKDSVLLYGLQFLSYNVHNLIHVAADVKRNGPLESYSAYKFENYLQIIKNLLFRSAKPLQQIVKRLNEYERNKVEVATPVRTCISPFTFHQHFDGPLATLNFGEQYQNVHYLHWKLSIYEPNNCVILNGNAIVLIINIVKNTKEVMIIFQRYLNNDNFFSSPIQSKKIGTFQVSTLSPIFEHCSITNITAKGVKIPINRDLFYVSSML